MTNNYYTLSPKTTANSVEFFVDEEREQSFPQDGFCFGTLHAATLDIPALIDFRETSKGLAFLYKDARNKDVFDNCLERLIWRIAVSVPSRLCQFLIFNGGNPGEDLNTLSLLNKKLFHRGNNTIHFSGNETVFSQCLDELIGEVMDRISEVSIAGVNNLVELNESLGDDSKWPYKFVVIGDFPCDFQPETIGKLSRLISIGNRAGIFTIMTWDASIALNDKRYTDVFDPTTLLANLMMVYPNGDRYAFRNSEMDEVFNSYDLHIDGERISDMAQLKRWSSYINQCVEREYTPKKLKALKQDFKTLESMDYVPEPTEICVSVGKDMATGKTIDVRFNSKDYIHAFILGQSGSGKSVLLNNIITSAVLKYSPEQLVLYLMDFKGVEFSRYKGLKHTKAVMVDNSDPQMTLEVLRELNDENRKRTMLWRKADVSDIDGYNRKNPQSRLPQILFVADECQVMFKAQTQNSYLIGVQREISDILNTIATQGRSQGIHMLLATQQLDEADISGMVLKNLTECFLLMSAPADSERLVPESSSMTGKQPVGVACYYHKKELCGQMQSYFATDEELADAIEAARDKANGCRSNGATYFSGSDIFQLDEEDLSRIEEIRAPDPVALIGREIGLSGRPAYIMLQDDFSENILFFGANRKEQTSAVLINSLISLINSYKYLDMECDFVVLDCSNSPNSSYKPVLQEMENMGLCRLADRRDSGQLLLQIASDISNDSATPMILAVICSERWVEMKRNLSLQRSAAPVDNGGVEPIGFDMDLLDLNQSSSSINAENMTFQQALTYILDEGPNQGVHVLLQVDKPSNILFQGEYDVNGTDKFKHKVMLRSENKYLTPMRFSQDIDVEILSDDLDRLRAYYYPEDGDPILFTPYIMPEKDIITK